MRIVSMALITTLAALGGCASLGGAFDDDGDAHLTKFGAKNMADRDAVEEVDLVSVISRGKKTCQIRANDAGARSADDDARARACGRMIDVELDNFEEQVTRGLLTPVVASRYRNSIQERLLFASDQRCGRYKIMLQQKYSNTNFATGVLATFLGTAGAIAPGVRDARALAGLTGAASGYRAEYNQAFYGNLMAHVVADGIDSRRRATYTQIFERGRNLPYDQYTLAHAVKDAIIYHSQCSLVTGLTEASDAIRNVNDPGLAASAKAIAQVRLAHGIASASEDNLGKAITSYQDVFNGKWFAGVPTQAAKRGASGLDIEAAVSENQQATARPAIEGKATVTSLTTAGLSAAQIKPLQDEIDTYAKFFKADGVCTKAFAAANELVSSAVKAQSVAPLLTAPTLRLKSEAAMRDVALFNAKLAIDTTAAASTLRGIAEMADAVTKANAKLAAATAIKDEKLKARDAAKTANAPAPELKAHEEALQKAVDAVTPLGTEATNLKAALVAGLGDGSLFKAKQPDVCPAAN